MLQYTAFFSAMLALGVAERLAGRSHRKGLARWPTNGALTLLNILVIGAIPLGAVAAADWARMHGLGLLNRMALDPAVALLAGILLRSLVGYAVHVAMHKVPVLWRVHRVHHTDRAMDVSTTVRFHPLEFAITVPVSLAATAALGLPPLAIMIYELVDAAMAVWTHADLRLPRAIEKILSLLLVTPGMHRIHHSAHQPETDSNYGALFSLWDRLFGTYRPAIGAPLALGLAEVQDRCAESLLWLLVAPLRRSLSPLEPATSKGATP